MKSAVCVRLRSVSCECEGESTRTSLSSVRYCFFLPLALPLTCPLPLTRPLPLPLPHLYSQPSSSERAASQSQLVLLAGRQKRVGRRLGWRKKSWVCVSSWVWVLMGECISKRKEVRLWVELSIVIVLLKHLIIWYLEGGKGIINCLFALVAEGVEARDAVKCEFDFE